MLVLCFEKTADANESAVLDIENETYFLTTISFTIILPPLTMRYI